MTSRGRGRVNPALFLLPAGAALLAGLDAALLLGGLPAPADRADLPDRHGMLLVLGFLGTLVALERAVALRRSWGYAAPGLLGLGGLSLAAGLPRLPSAVLLVDGCLALLAVYASLHRRQRDEGTAVEALAAVGALVGALLWLRVDVAGLLPWLVSFVLLTITAERVELARLHRPAGAERTLLMLAVLVLVAAGSTLLLPGQGLRLFGSAVLVLTVWTARGDVAFRTVRIPGLPRFSAVALLTGYVWLLVAALTWIIGGPPRSVAAYDTVVHATFLGFAMSMVLAHAPIILPAVIRRPMPYRRFLWLPLIVLHLGLVLRIVVGNAFENPDAWRLGATLTVVALLLLPLTAASSVILGRRGPSPHSRTGSPTVPHPIPR